MQWFVGKQQMLETNFNRLKFQVTSFEKIRLDKIPGCHDNFTIGAILNLEFLVISQITVFKS